jgi:aromatic-L-amino-acid decarboxylase
MPHDLNQKDPYEELLTEAATRAYNYLRTIRERNVGVPQEAIEKLPSLGGPMPAYGEDPRAVIQLLDEVDSPATMASMGPRMFGGVIGGAFPAAVAAHWLADAWDQNACPFDFAPIAAYLEDVVLDWLLDLFGLPAASGGAFVTGTQMADVTALAAARYDVLRKVGWNIEQDGLFGAPPMKANAPSNCCRNPRTRLMDRKQRLRLPRSMPGPANQMTPFGFSIICSWSQTV